MGREKITITKRKAKGVLADMIADMDEDSLARTREKMERITEDYCSYELTKLLNEKGFYGHTHGNLSEIPCVPQITHQIACKWLREVHNIIIVIDYNEEDDVEENERYGFSVYQNNVRKVDLATYVTYEETVEAALKYSLENLI